MQLPQPWIADTTSMDARRRRRQSRPLPRLVRTQRPRRRTLLAREPLFAILAQTPLPSLTLPSPQPHGRRLHSLLPPSSPHPQRLPFPSDCAVRRFGYEDPHTNQARQICSLHRSLSQRPHLIQARHRPWTVIYGNLAGDEAVLSRAHLRRPCSPTTACDVN